MQTYRCTADRADAALIAERVTGAHDWVSRLCGLLGRRALTDEEGLWLKPCKSIHTVGMRFAIDAVFLDDENRVTKIGAGLPPWRVCFAPRATQSVLELKAGRVKGVGLQVGDRLVFGACTEMFARATVRASEKTSN